jgi:Zn-dependent protease
MQPDNNQPSPGAPRYPGAEYYREMAAKGAAPSPGYPPPPAGTPSPGYAQSGYPSGAPRLPPVQAAPRPQPVGGHNAFTRFIIAWGGWNRFWIFLGSGVVSAFVYTYLFSNGDWAFGLGVVLLICVHEFGHAFALRIKRLPATLPIFIPGIGAFVTLPNQPISLRDDAEISLAGPFLGGIGALVCFLIGVFTLNAHTTDAIFLNLASFGFFLNALNLIPILPLDGGHIGRAISRWSAVAGLAIIGLLYLATHNIIFLLIGFYGLTDVMQSFNQPFRPLTMRPTDRVVVSLMYGGVALLLVLCWAGVNTPQVLGFVIRLLRPDLAVYFPQ